jgi:hypothetical protein
MGEEALAEVLGGRGGYGVAWGMRCSSPSCLPPPSGQPTESTAWRGAPHEESDPDESDRSAR